MSGSKTNYLTKKLLDHVYGATAYTAPATLYWALLAAKTWQANTVYASGDYIIPTTFSAGQRIYKCTTAGTSGGSEPSWGTTPGGTTADGTAVWTEQTNAMEGGVVPEFTTTNYTNYARVGSTNNTTNYPNATGTTTGAKSNGTQVNFPTPTLSGVSTVQAVGLAIFDASSGGNCLDWMTLPSAKVINAGDPVYVAASGWTKTED